MLVDRDEMEGEPKMKELKAIYGCCYEAKRQGIKCPIHERNDMKKCKQEARTVEIKKTIIDFLCNKPEHNASYKEISKIVDKKFGAGYCRYGLYRLRKEKELCIIPRQYQLNY